MKSGIIANCIGLIAMQAFAPSALAWPQEEAAPAEEPILLTIEERAESDYARKAFQNVLPFIDKAAQRVDEHDSLPRSAWFGRDQKSNTETINSLIDDAVDALGISQAGGLRAQIRTLEERIADTTKKVGEYREKRIGAPTNDATSKLDQYNPFHTTKEGYDEKIAAAEVQLEEDRAAVDALRARFAASLRAIGLDVSDEAAESLLATVSGDDFITMCVVFDNLKIVTLQLHALVDHSGEEPTTVRRYYGMYVIIAKILDRIQGEYLAAIRDKQIPLLKDYTKQAEENISEARRLMRSGAGNRDTLLSNIEANELTIEAAGFYIDYLDDMAALIAEQHIETKRILATAMNTYKTVDVSVNVGQLISDGSKSLERLMQLEMPELRSFNNDVLRREYHRLSDKMRKER